MPAATWLGSSWRTLPPTTKICTLESQPRRTRRACSLNVVDRPQLCDFIMPSVMERGDLVIATSTGGASPAMARRIRCELEEIFGPEYALALTLLRRVRESLAASSHTGAERQRIFNALVDSPLLDYIRQRPTPRHQRAAGLNRR